MDNAKKNEDIYTFVKLKDIKNYKKWDQKIRFALWDTCLINYAYSTSIKLKLCTVNKKCQKNKSALLLDKKIEKQKAKVEKWILNNLHTYGKIGLIYIRAVEQ